MSSQLVAGCLLKNSVPGRCISIIWPLPMPGIGTTEVPKGLWTSLHCSCGCWPQRGTTRNVPVRELHVRVPMQAVSFSHPMVHVGIDKLPARGYLGDLVACRRTAARAVRVVCATRCWYLPRELSRSIVHATRYCLCQWHALRPLLVLGPWPERW